MKDKIFSIVKEAVENLNEELDYDSLNNVTNSTALFGGEDGIDSLSLVMLVTEVEGEVNDAFEANVVLASEKTMSMRNSPYNSVGAFVEFIQQELNAS